ncbi:ribosome maturation factor RimP [Arthrobacter sp. zg-Y20]|uniref:ribosome maturation factor RimP n=1 Tax=unclassified Arthrobacter TaxID=235627 RepID=UPI001D1406A7|nr:MULTISPECIES: ribosome maturation factor RimP [unclassified Arthrobacter]MCC3277074.1 ribosome maturation factor RimP [Arthrobacter sp. zg-Y20]MDK1317235.1 ribosome maturation factor RimP [Arthrobacter sp. zg.Y20]WIB07324.1 ribosome maturation factor RimP [Arthrobacter sp. zg-Y20]
MAVRPNPKKDTSSDYRKNAMRAEVAAETQRLKQYLAPTVEMQDLFLEDIEIKMAGAHRTVHVVVDLPETQVGGVSLDRISAAAQAISEAMDNDPHDDGRPYNLEVSSPGVSRPLTEPRHWRRNVARMVSVSVVNGDDVMGRIVSVDDDGITLIPELPVKKGMKAKQGDPLHLPFANIRKGRVEVEFAHLEDDPAGEDAPDDETTAEEA